ncbi:MAG: hypothetical protein IPJ04_08330 [Candidatus Eisenbacteria bacterium]|nr:hypothetical protein [Candidatus Eisenbacteria bacterium]
MKRPRQCFPFHRKRAPFAGFVVRVAEPQRVGHLEDRERHGARPADAFHEQLRARAAHAQRLAQRERALVPVHRAPRERQVAHRLHRDGIEVHREPDVEHRLA